MEDEDVYIVVQNLIVVNYLLNLSPPHETRYP